MSRPIEGITRLIHSDWSKDPRRRWSCWAERSATGWRAYGPAPYHDRANWFFARNSDGVGLAGFDHPIGVPAFWAERAGIDSFRSLLDEFAHGRRATFFEVAMRPEDISIERPFYPYRPGGHTQASLLAGLGATDMDQLMRACERRTTDRRSACCLFWTLGGNQVGKAALAGWREVVLPKVQEGFRLWPFDGDLSTLAGEGGPILAETYPAEAYGHIGLRFGPQMRKGRQEDRKAQATALFRWASAARVELAPELRHAIEAGFGASQVGDDQFDAMAGLAGMIEVVDGRRAEAPAERAPCCLEGWILGQAE